MANQHGVGIDHHTYGSSRCLAHWVTIRKWTTAAFELMRRCCLPQVRAIGIIWILLLAMSTDRGFATEAVETECLRNATVIELTELHEYQRQVDSDNSKLAINAGRIRLLSRDSQAALLTQLIERNDWLCWLGGHITSHNGRGMGLVFTSDTNVHITVHGAVLVGFENAIVLDNLSTDFVLSSTRISDSINCLQLQHYWSRVSIRSSLLEGCSLIDFSERDAGMDASRELVLENSLVTLDGQFMNMRTDIKVSIRMSGNTFMLTQRRDFDYLQWLEAHAVECRDNIVIVQSGDLPMDTDSRCLTISSNELEWHQRRASWLLSHRNDDEDTYAPEMNGQNALTTPTANVRQSQFRSGRKLRRSDLRAQKYGEEWRADEEGWSDRTRWTDGTGWIE